MSQKKNKCPEVRRDALKKILTGTTAAGIVAVAPEKWTKPVIDSVTLPAHAQTSAIPLSFVSTNLSASIIENMIETLLPSAYAGAGIEFGNLCINFQSDLNTYSATIAPVLYLPDGNDVFMTATNGTLDSPTQMDLPCDTEDATITLTNLTATGVDYSISDGGEPVTGTATPMDCTLAVQECD